MQDFVHQPYLWVYEHLDKLPAWLQVHGSRRKL